MNPNRVFLICNRYLVFCGFIIHKYSAMSNNYFQSRQGLCTFALVQLAYIACLYKHLTEPEIVELFEALSIIVYRSIYVHLFLGITNTFTINVQYRPFLNLAREITAFLQDFYAKHSTDLSPIKLSHAELFVYYKMFSNTIICISIVAYDLTIIDLGSITLSKVMLLLALVYPHCNVANVQRYFTLNALVMAHICEAINVELGNICLVNEMNVHGQYTQFIEIVSQDSDHAKPVETGPKTNETQQTRWQQIKSYTMPKNKRKPDILMVLATIKSAEDLNVKLMALFQMSKKVREFYKKLNAIMQFQMFLLIVQHSLVAFVIVHMIVEMYLEWDVFFGDRESQMVKINFFVYLAMMCNDCLCMAVTAKYFERVVSFRTYIYGDHQLIELMKTLTFQDCKNAVPGFRVVSNAIAKRFGATYSII